MRPRSAEDAPVRVERQLDRRALPAALRRRDQVLAPVLDPLDRPPELDRGQRHHRRLDRQRALGAERAADVRDDHAQRALVQPEDLRQLRARTVRALRGGPDRHAVALAPGERAAGLHRRRRQARDHVLGAHDVGGAGEGARDVTRALLPARELRARPRVEDRRQDLVVDLDALDGVLGLGARLAHDDRDRLADVAHLARPPAPDAARRRRSSRVARRRAPAPHGRRSRTPSTTPRARRGPERARAGCARRPCAPCPRAGCRPGTRSVRTGSARPRDGGPAGRSTPRRPLAPRVSVESCGSQ